MHAVKSVPITLDRRRFLRYERRYIYMLEERTGQTIVQIFQLALAGSFKALVDIIHAGLLHEAPALDVLDVADWVDLGDVEEKYAAPLTEALASAFPSPENEDGQEKKAPTRQQKRSTARKKS